MVDPGVAARMRELWAEVTAQHPDWPDPKVSTEVLRRLDPADREDVADSAETVVAESAWFLRRDGRA